MKDMPVLLAGVLAGAALCAAAEKKPMAVQVEERGTLVVRGVTWPETGGWAAENVVAFGPNWEYSAQDYAAKSERNDLTQGEYVWDGILGVPNAKMKFHQEIRNVKDKPYAKTVSWKFTPEGGREKLNANRIFSFFPLAQSVFTGGAYSAGGHKRPLPNDGETTLAGPGPFVFESADGGTTIAFWDVKDADVKLVAPKDKKKQWEVQFDFRNTKDGKETSIAYSFLAEGHPKFAAKPWTPPPPPKPKYVITNGAAWTVFPFTTQVKDNTILDFSGIFKNDCPASSKHGRLVPDTNGHLVGEKSGERVRLVGANLNFDANSLKHSEKGGKTREEKKALQHAACDKLAKDFRRMGYNAVRYHHHDVTLQKNDWQAWDSADIDPEELDRVDYMFFAMKREGMYSTTDLYQMRRFAEGEIEGLGKLDYGQVKGFIPFHPPAFKAWCKFAEKLMNHVNPYTGIAWKHDPSLVFICPVNEDSIMSVSGGAKLKPFVAAAFSKWREAEGKDAAGDEKAVLARFLIAAKLKSQKETADFLRGLGVKALMTSENWWDLKSQTPIRAALDIVDNHGYADHPQGWPKQYWNQCSNTKCSHAAYHIPVMKAPSRVFGKPMVITEWNFCQPNRYRAESGPTMGAYAALQDWDALYRFAWSHETKRVVAQSPIAHFDIVNDPVNQLSERLTVLLFRRGDAAPAKEAYCYAVDEEEATKDGRGDMWAKGLFNNRFVTQGFIHRIGSQYVGKGGAPKGNFEKVVTGENVKELPELYKSEREFISDTGEITLCRKGRLLVATPKTEVIVAYKGGEKDGGFTAGGLSLKPVETFTTIAASAMDGADLRKSKKILLFHLTNAVNSDENFDSEKMHTIEKAGTLPYLAFAAKAEVSFKSDVRGLKLHAIRSDGTFIRDVPANYEKDAYSFTLEISGREEATMTYELVAR